MEHNVSVAKPGGELFSLSPHLVPCCSEPPCFKLTGSLVLILTCVWNSTSPWEKLGPSSRVPGWGVGGVLFLPSVNSRIKVLVFAILHYISAKELNVVPYPRAFMTLLILLMSIASSLSSCHVEGQVKRVIA